MSLAFRADVEESDDDYLIDLIHPEHRIVVIVVR
jgi:hypothetical protein